MLVEFKKYIQNEKLFSKKKPILLGVSGGIDSMVMADLFLKSEYQFAIAHCNFQLRGAESDNDELFVKKFAADKQIPFFSIRIDTEKFSRSNGISIQMAARELRMNWFNDLCISKGYNCIATAHHLDDQNETFFINLLRGSGIAGFHGILPASGKIVHPLMFSNREAITSYALKNSVSYREDSSNNKDDYLRNNIRHNLIPLLNEMKPGFSDSLSESILKLQSVENIYNIHLTKVWNSISQQDDKITKINIQKLKKLPELHTHLFEFLRPFGYNFSDAKQIKECLEGDSGKTFYSKSHRLIIDRSSILLHRIDLINTGDDEFQIYEDTSFIKEPIPLQIRIHPRIEKYKILKETNIALLDVNCIKFPLKLRKWKQGDHFYPLGMKGKKLVSDFFTDQKFSLIQKEKTWLLISGNDIVWIVGHRIDDRFKISDRTKSILEIIHLPN